MKAEIEQAFDTLSTILCESRLHPESQIASAKARGVIRAHVEELTGALAAGDERLIAAAGRAGVVYVGCDTPDALAGEIERLREALRGETKSHAETAGFLQDRKDQLATICSTLSAVLGDGEPVEQIAEAVHNGWMDEKRKQGFHGPHECTKEPCKYCHPDMLPYSMLTENIKEYDRATARAVAKAIKAAIEAAKGGE